MATITDILKEEIQRVLKKGLQSAFVSDAIGVAGRQIVHDNFEAEGRPKWKPWSEAYQQQRLTEPYPLKIGTRTAALRKSIKAVNVSGGSMLSTKVSYAGKFSKIRPIFTFPAGSAEILSKEITLALNRS